VSKKIINPSPESYDVIYGRSPESIERELRFLRFRVLNAA